MSLSHTKQPQQVLDELHTDAKAGLTTPEAKSRLVTQGPNKLVEEREIRFVAILREEVTEPMILLLLAIGVIYGVINQGNLTDSLTIISVVVILVLAEVWNEYRAKKSINALRKLAAPTTSVLRDGRAVEVPTLEVVQGDIILLRTGDRVPADARLLDAVGLEVEESALTGESFPIAKDAAITLTPEVSVNEQRNMVFAGTVTTKGHATAVVTATGIKSELGRVAGITKAAREPKTPLQLSMKQLSKTLIWLALFFAILIPVLAFLRGLAPTQAVLYGLSLAFAVIPEEMPIIITMVLGIGAYALSRRHALVKRLRAADTLGGTTVIATDKTGTITEGKMRLETLYFNGKTFGKSDFGADEKEALKTALLAAEPIKMEVSEAKVGNPMAQAIIKALDEKADIVEGWTLKDELSFDNKRKLASYVYQSGDTFTLFSSGAPENVLANSAKIQIQGQEKSLTQEARKQVEGAVSDIAQSGQRLLAFGYRKISAAQRFEKQNLEQDLVFSGVVGFVDPPRKEVKEAIGVCKEAGIKVIMVTGDHPETALAIAGEVGIENARALTGNEIAKMSDDDLKTDLKRVQVYARATPEDKLRLVRLLREIGEIVAVTGDGINDAPALKEAHIGIAMGVRGTDVAKESADMVLADDNFATITTAVEEGRKIFANLKKGVRYYLACKIALVASFLATVALNVPLPFAPIQIIVLELFMDLAASATFVAEPEETGIMNRPPLDPKEKFMNRQLVTTMSLGAASLFAAVATCYLYTWFTTGDLVLSQTIAFATWMVGHIFLALNLRSEKEPLVKLGIGSNRLMLLWALVVAVTLLAGTYLPYLHESLRITTMSPANWALVLGVAFAATFWMELKKLIQG